MGKSDICLAVGGPTGLGFLSTIHPDSVSSVLPFDEQVASGASKLGFELVPEVADCRFLLSFRFGRIFTANELHRVDIPLNIHPGWLPRYRGMRPSFWALYEQGVAGVSIHRVEERIDAGVIYHREMVPYDSSTTGGQLAVLINDLEIRLAQTYLGYMQDDALPPPLEIKEPLGRLRTLDQFVTLRDNPPLDSMEPEQIHRLVRALSHPQYAPPPWAGAWMR